MVNGEKMTRRDFVGAAVVGSVGLAASSLLAGCGASSVEESGASQPWDEEADVIVVGSGGAGHAAALEAARAGASVIILEKREVTGGDSSLCDGILGGAGTRLAKAQGIDLTADDVYAWFVANPEWYGSKNPVVARVNAEEGGKTIDWLQDNGVPFEETVGPRFGYTELPVIHQVQGKGSEMMRVLVQLASEEGIKTVTNTAVKKLVFDASGRVVGVEAMEKSKMLRFKANKGVVLATGGYGGNGRLLTSLNAECINARPAKNPGSMGDGLVMGLEAGALASRTSNTPLLNSLAGMEVKSVVNLNYSERLHGLWLDANGERFFNEETPYENPNGHRAILRKQNEQGKQVVVLLPTTPELDSLQAVRPLEWAKADTVEEVAGMVGLDPVKVKATVDRYNGFCELGRDEDFGRPAEFLIPMTGPFYAAMVTTSAGSVTVGGLKTNDKGQVLRLKIVGEEEDPTEIIPGLYGAGSVCEWNCAAGATVLSAMAFGRVVGRNVVLEDPSA